MLGRCVKNVVRDHVDDLGPAFMIHFCHDERLLVLCDGCRGSNVNAILAEARLALAGQRDIGRLFRNLRTAAKPPAICEYRGGG